MIQPLNSIHSNSYNSRTNQSFAKQQHTAGADFKKTMKKQKAVATAKFLGREFLTGAAVSLVVDSLANAWHVIRKTPDAMTKGGQMIQRAGFWGVAWVAMGLVISAFASKGRNN